MRRLAAALCLLLAAGCGLPLGGGVKAPGAVPAEQRQGGDIQVLPPAPRDDAPPDEIVRGFFRAQSSPGNAHASARAFLAPELRRTWRDNGVVSVLGSALQPASVDGVVNAFRVTGSIIGQIATDGSYSPVSGVLDIRVELRKGPRGRWLITKVPDGLVLSATDRERSFRARNIYFLAPPSSPGAAASHLVPDQVFLPVTAASADALVRRLLAGPSRPLGDSVTSAFPAGTAVRRVRTDASGLVTVDLTEQVGRASAVLREQMSAQLVWTLRDLADAFSRLRLLSAGRQVGVLRDRSDWQPYDPDGLIPHAPLYYVGGRRLRLLEPPPGPASASQQRVVDDAAVSPRGGSVALLTALGSGAELRTGPPSGPFALRARAASLSFPSWGSGEQGVWFLENGRVMLAPLAGRTLGVPVDGLGGLGPISGLRVSRDGVRVGLIVGSAKHRQLVVGRVAERNGSPRVVGVRPVAPGVVDVGDLSWESATSLVVLGRASGVTAPVRVAIDGSAIALVNRIGLELSSPVSIAAAPERPLVVGARIGGVNALFRDDGLKYVKEQGIEGTAPFYPG
ncbi:MAG: Lipoprotein LpqB, beta-propeller domain-like protein [Frankiales bacterium]|nr:Lipoprotein LpqB, beta-propeller domain-like protein [Frankiales bacterium]